MQGLLLLYILFFRVWKEWTIVNKTFEAMHMTAGDICVGQVDREIKVRILTFLLPSTLPSPGGRGNPYPLKGFSSIALSINQLQKPNLG